MKCPNLEPEAEVLVIFLLPSTYLLSPDPNHALNCRSQAAWLGPLLHFWHRFLRPLESSRKDDLQLLVFLLLLYRYPYAGTVYRAR